MKHLLSVQDLSVEEMLAIFKRAKEYKKKPVQPVLANRTLAMLFEKPSTRTRVSFEVGMNQLGGHAVYMDYNSTQLGRGETPGDTARVLSRYCDAIMARVNRHGTLVELTKNSSVPVINGLSDMLHPCQALSDMFTIHEKLGMLRGLKLAYLGNGKNNTAHSLLHACSKMGINMSIASPRKCAPDNTILRGSKANAKASGSVIEVVSGPETAVKNADIVYTDTWFSMGDKFSPSKREELRPYQLNDSLLKHAKRHAIVMHCLPAHRGEEITDSVMDGEQSVVWDQAENRLHVQKGILSLVI
jgi:ornithine carbamoyltransferase